MSDARRPGRILYRDAALADGRSDRLQVGMSVLTLDYLVVWIRPIDAEGEPDAGVLREGGPADFSLVHGDPLSDPAALWRVWRVSWSPDPVVV